MKRYKKSFGGISVEEIKCPKCESSALENFGLGSQKVELVARKFFPDYRIERLDSDSLSKKNEHIEILKRFQDGK